jgi:hypothetical protein
MMFWYFFLLFSLLLTGYLWDTVRVMGGAYGGFCRFSPLTGTFSYLSYRDPNLLTTLDNYDGAPAFLQGQGGGKGVFVCVSVLCVCMFFYSHMDTNRIKILRESPTRNEFLTPSPLSSLSRIKLKAEEVVGQVP